MTVNRLQCVLFVLAGLCPGLLHARVLQPNDRIVFVGDSITGHGGNNKSGFVHLMDAAMKEDWPQSNLTLIPLGGSGQSVGSWIDVELKSRTVDRALDVPGVMIKTTLDQHADVLIVMLGMNDVLYPYLAGTPQDLAAWQARYETLLNNLRQRLHPRVIALATVTMATEDADSPKNKLGGLLNERIANLAKEQGCLLLQTNAVMQEMLRLGRTWRPDFHVTVDYVHPSQAGHVAIALAMLRGLQEDAAAKALEKTHLPLLRGTMDDLSISYAIAPQDASPIQKEQEFLIHYWVNRSPAGAATPVKATLSVPQGWRARQAADENESGTFSVVGEPEQFKNTLKLDVSAGDKHQSADIIIPAPWLVATGFDNHTVWTGTKFTPEKGELPADAQIARGDIDLSVANTQPAQTAIAWRRYFPSVNYTGGNDAASIDFWSCSIGRTFDTAYAVRWVFSPQPRAIHLRLSTRAFAGTAGLTAWMNGDIAYSGLITSEPGETATVAANLVAGWNCLALKSNHLAWLWQVEANLVGDGGDTLSDLRISTAPPPVTTAKN